MPIKLVMAIVLFFSSICVAFADIGFTGGSYDGYGANVSVDFNLGGPDVTISSAANQSFVVGQASTAISSITITDSTGGAITALNGLRIRIPSVFGMVWDTTKTTATISGTASAKVSTVVSYEGLGQILVLNVTANFLAGEYITVGGLSFTSFTAAASPDYLGLDIYNTGASYIKDNKTIQIISSAGVLFAGGSYDGYFSFASGDILLSSANTDYFLVTHPTYNAGVGVATTVTITAKDATGTIIATYAPATSVSVTKSESGSVPLSATLGIISPFSGGAATVTLTDTEVENVSVTATDQTYTTMTGTSLPITFTATTASKAALSGPASVAAGVVSTAFTLISKDTYGNTSNVVANTVFSLTSNSTGTVTFYSDAAGTLPITSTTIAAGTNSKTFYYKDTKTGTPTITATYVSGDIMTPSTATGTTTVNPGTKTKLAFKQQPPSTATINNVLASQPIVAIEDAYGNQTTDTDPITLYASTSNSAYAAAPGILAAVSNPLSAITGQANFSGVKYNTTGVIYLYAQAGTLQPVFSTGITFSTAGDSTVEAATSPVTNFNLIPTNSALANKFAGLSFKVKDTGTDSVPTQIDRIQVTVGGTGNNASTDIAWAGLYQGATQVATATGSAITNSTITFGITPNSNSTADLYSITDNTAVELTVYIYMKPGKLAATEGQTYTFSINEAGIGTDTGLSSQMSANTNKVTTVTGAITVVASYLEIVEQATGNSSISVAPGSPIELTIRGTDANKNIDKDYINNHTFIFSGLANIGSYQPAVEGVALGYNTTVNFPISPGGVSAANAATLTAYKAETASLSVSEVGQSYAVFPLAVTVTAPAASAASMSLASGDSQSGKVSVALANPFVASVKDTYGNVVSGASVTFAISSVPSGATGQVLSVTSATTSANGQAQTVLTLGNTAGQYQVTATSTGLTGSPITFTSTAVTPSTLNKVSGDSQSKTVALALTSPLVVKLVGAGNVAIPNETVTFAISSVPSGATGQALSVTSAATDANGQAQTVFTLGNKTGDYVVTVSYAGLTSVNFTATGLAGTPYKVVLSGPGSSNAGVVSTAFSAIIKDSYDNLTNAVTATSFLLTSNAATGSFYSDSGGATSITSITVAVDASSAAFYYKDTAIGIPTITAARSAGDSLNVSSSSASINILAAGLDHFAVTGATTTLTAGGSRLITITAYDAYGNVKTNLSSDMAIVFSGANVSLVPSSNSPTASNNLGNDINFGADTLLTFTNGVATATLKLYKAESVLIKSSALPVTTSGAQALGFVVKHNTADHLKFSGTVNGSTVGTSISLGALNAVDLYNNLCDGADGGASYTGSKTISYVLSGLTNAPDGSATDLWPANPVSFTNGASAALSATLYRAQSTTITAGAADLTGANIASNSITMQAAAMGKLWFSQQPSTNPFTNVALPAQPKVNVADQYGNAVTSVSDQVSLLPSLTSGTYTPVTNGTLGGDSLAVVIVNGVATFSGIKYSYPESVYLKAHSVGNLAPDIYSYQITFKAGADTTIATGPLVKPTSISSLIYTDAAKLQVFDFKVTDAGSDGYATKLKQIIIARNTATDTTGGWQSYIAGAAISDGTTSIMGTITNDALTFGTGTSIISSVPDGQSKTYTLSVYLNQTLPAGADGKAIAFSVNPATNLTVDSPGSAFAAASAITSSLVVDVTATKFMVSGDSAIVAAGASSTVTTKATDINNNLDTDYSGVKEIIFSGANSATSAGTTYNPTCTNYSAVDIAFGNITLVSFTSGQNTSTITMKLYKAESAAVKVKTSDAVITTLDANALGVVVTGGAASKLSWNTQPVATVVANAPWSSFKVSVVDTYGNIAPSAINVTVVPTGGTLSVGATAQVATVSGIAAFDNLAVYCAAYPGTVTLNATAAGVTASGASDNVTVIEKYAITIKAFDSVNGSPLTELTLKIIDSNTGQLITGLTNPIIGNSPFSFNLPYGKYSFNFNKTAYVESTVNKTADVSADAVDGAYDNNISWTVFLMSTAESLADYKVLSNFVYDEANDRITGLVRLEKRGKQITSDDINTLKTGTLKIFDSSDAVNPKYTASLAVPDANGNYYFNIDNAVAAKGFVRGRNYFAKMTILYGGVDLSTNVTYSAANDFTISVMSTLNTLAGQIAASVSSEGALTRSQLTSKIESTAAATQAKVAEVSTQAGQILTTTSTTIPAQITTAQTAITDTITTKVKPHITSGILNSETSIKQGGKITIRYRTATGLAPFLNIYSPKDVLLLSNKRMTEIGATGIYEYNVTFLASWGLGFFTVICSESTNGTVDALVMMVTQSNLEDVSGQVSAVLGSTSGLNKLRNVGETISAQFSDMDKLLTKISTDVAGKLGDAKSAVNDLASAFKQLEDMSKQIKDIGGTKGLNLEKLYEVSKDKNNDITYIKNKSQELKAAMELNRKLLEDSNKKPVVQSWFEFK
ncbi:MAG: Ig-like domain-containing protein [Candidatus Omnitrophica bacterium]|nr:Ig-like domain-containing protein [Candidatus Omnitrophota bacterium]MBU4302934.1 Ig-like domain-containing protein [Candidatus Omnitrophota bacterium]MBU4467370.1 Ig-like domain-containing protein [Candidatus Omnitrophota bacterium]MCG2708464.1 Ig-like domain-containing protein [Candidatus Omnitrophota bacterium]